MDSFQFDVIYTLNAQGNVMLSVMTEAFRLTDNQVFNEIQRSAAELRAVLESKGIHYKDMKRALVPNTDRLERAFVFDWTKFDTGRYGQEANEMLLPLLERRSSRSVLLGGWASKYRFNRIYEASFGANINPKIAEAARLADTLYFVYLNNLTPAAVARIDLSLAKHPAYAGNVDLTYTTPIKEGLQNRPRSCMI